MSAERGASGGVIGRLLARVATIQPNELPAVVVSFCLFFCVLGGYFAVRPVRETVGTLLGRERVADLWVVTLIASLIIVPLYGALVARVRRSVFLPLIYGLIAVALAITGVVLNATEDSIATSTFFYVFISVLNLFVVSVFWSFLLELFDHTQSKRLFGVIAAGGTAGALAGPVITDVTVKYIGNGGILFLGASLFAVAIVFQWILLAIWKRPSGAQQAPRQDRAIGGNPFAGFWIVVKSPYLLGIASFVLLLASVTTFLYFEQLRIVSETFADSTERTRVFARLDWVVQSLTIVSQVFITGRVASKLGLGVLLTVVPVAMIFGFVALGFTGAFAVFAVVMVMRRAGEYAFVRPGREMLWSRLDSETKYKAKNLIDVPVYRFADALVAQVSDRILGTLGPGVLAVAGACTAAVWAVNGWWLGKRHDRAEAAEATATAASRSA